MPDLVEVPGTTCSTVLTLMGVDTGYNDLERLVERTELAGIVAELTALLRATGPASRRATTERACKDCGTDFRPVNARQTRCPRCQVVQDLTYRKCAGRSCDLCARTFHPSRASWRTCPWCSPAGAVDPDRHAACGHCGEHRPPAIGLDKTCVACVQSTKEMAQRYLASLKRDLPAPPDPDPQGPS